MSSQLKTIEIFDKLQPDGGVKKGVVSNATICSETIREDGVDQLILAFPMTHILAPVVVNGWSPRVILQNGTIREYLVSIIEEDLFKGIITLTCLGARTRLAGYTVTDATLTTTGANLTAEALDSAGAPSWVTTSSAIGGSYTVTRSGDTILSYMEKIISAIDATLSSGADPCVWSFTPTISSGVVTGYVITSMLSVPNGTARLAYRKNISRITRRRDTSDPVFPVTGYALVMKDHFRNDPTHHPDDDLMPFQKARLDWTPLSIDIMIRIVSVVIDHLRYLSTTLELGTPKRRLQQTVATVTAAADATTAAIDAIPAPALQLEIVPVSVSSTQVVMRLTAATPGNNIGTQVTTVYLFKPITLAVSPGYPQTFFAYKDLTTSLGASQYTDYTITRDLFGGSATTVTFQCSAPGYQDTSISINVETVADLASATKTLRLGAGAFVPNAANTAGGVLVLNGDGAVEMAVVGTGSFSAPLPLPEGVTITALSGILWGSGGGMVAIIYDNNNNPVGSFISASGATYASYTQALSEYVGTGGSVKTYRLVIFFTTTGGSAHDARAMSLTVSYTSPALENTY